METRFAGQDKASTIARIAAGLVYIMTIVLELKHTQKQCLDSYIGLAITMDSIQQEPSLI